MGLFWPWLGDGVYYSFLDLLSHGCMDGLVCFMEKGLSVSATLCTGGVYHAMEWVDSMFPSRVQIQALGHTLHAVLALLIHQQQEFYDQSLINLHLLFHFQTVSNNCIYLRAYTLS